MSPHLKHLFDQALDAEPVPPAGDLADRAMQQGRRIRRRRGLLVGAPVAAAAVAVTVGLLASTPADPPPEVPAAATMLARAEPQCTWAVSGDATDVSLFLRDDATTDQQQALDLALRADPLVGNLLFESREQAFQKFKVLWRDSPDFAASVDAAQLPTAFRFKLTQPSQYPAFAAAYRDRAGVADVVGGACP